MKIVFLDYLDIPAADQLRLQTLGEVIFYEDVPASEADILDLLTDAVLVVVSFVDLTAAVIRQLPHLRYIISAAVGYDNIAVTAATEAGIRVINCPTHNAIAVAEYTIALMLAVSRKMFAAQQSLQQGIWNTWKFQGCELRGKTLGLIGYGTIAKTIEPLAVAFGIQVKTATSRTPAEELDHLIATADFLSLHLPLTARSHHLLDARRLSLMKPSAYLINTARGAIVDQATLLQVLKHQQIAGAALDVFEQEPVDQPPTPEIVELASLEQVIASPHIAYHTIETAQRLAEELIQNIQACLSDRPINVVNSVSNRFKD
jgi:phosphoglycerate dehydrogenase-like enzyme